MEDKFYQTEQKSFIDLSRTATTTILGRLEFDFRITKLRLSPAPPIGHSILNLLAQCSCSVVIILNSKKMTSWSPSATDEAWHWPKPGYSISGEDRR